MKSTITQLNQSALDHIKQKNPTAAIKDLQKALHLNPNSKKTKKNLADLYNNLGASLHKIHPAAAKHSYLQALALKPNYTKTLANLVELQIRSCDWRDLNILTHQLDSRLKKAKPKDKPQERLFNNIIRSDDKILNLKLARSWSNQIAKKFPPIFTSYPKKPKNSKVHLGYLSDDFHDHPIAHLILRLFKYHSRSKFITSVYSYDPKPDNPYRQTILKDADNFSDISSLTNVKAAEKIHADAVDILIDLKGYTKDHNLSLLSLRPAPINITWLGFPATTGASFIDYAIIDPVVTPPSHAKYYSENLITLPHSYQVNDNAQPISRKKFTRKDFGLPQKAFIFACFNQPYKIDPVIFDTWANIFSSVPNSVLWQLESNESVTKNLTAELKSRNIDPDRLIFTKRLPKDQHLKRLALADLSLDTRICNGHTTTADSLWAGVPVITLLGSHFASRVSASLLNAIHLPELITKNLKEYEALAINLATHPQKLTRLKQKLTKNRLTTPLFDTPLFAKHLEEAYFKVWNIYQKSSPPRNIRIQK